MSYLELCPGRQVTVSRDPFYDGDVTVEVFDEGNHVPICAIVLTSDEAIDLGRKIIANAIASQIKLKPQPTTDPRTAQIRKVLEGTG
jgi:hypothetical protein